MAKRWQVNTASGPRVIDGKLLQPGEGTWVDDGPSTADLSPRLTAAAFAAMAARSELVDGKIYVVDGLMRQAISGRESELVGVNDRLTAGELTALADAGGLTPYATYIASDDPYPQWAIDAYTLGSPLGGNYINVQVAGAGRGTIEV